MANIPAPGEIIDLGKLFANTFGGKPYHIQEESKRVTEGTPYRISGTNAEQLVTGNGSLIKEQVKGVDIWFPVRFYNPGDSTPIEYLPYTVVRVTGKKTIVKTPVMYRKGTVKEQYNIDDYSISIKGFLIGENGEFPEQDMDSLKDLFELKRGIQIDNAITNIFLSDPGLSRFEQNRVVIESLDFPEVEGGRINVKPFNMQLVSDFVFTLELK
ncbi:MAG: DUF6046 domain-containing protein [Agriterribacter sp.]